MAKYHPDSRFLSDYAAGTLPRSQAVCVAAHLEFCGKCRSHVEQLTNVGAVLFEQLAPEPVSSELLCHVLDEVNEFAEPSTALAPAAGTARASNLYHGHENEIKDLPRVVRSMVTSSVNDLHWVTLGSHLRLSRLNTGDLTKDTSLYHIKAGGRIPEHKHDGEEITVVLRGSFSDAEDIYQQGDFIVRGVGNTHRPIATQDGDCLCLATSDYPIVPTNWFYRLINPLVQAKLNKAFGKHSF